MAEPRRERKVVTVLFADLVGSTARAERMDPEDVEAELSRYHAHVRGELERFGGTVEKFIGDAVMAVFGAPAAHEDDPERAVRAALAVSDWAREGDELEVRIGVNTGEALVKLGARPEAGEGMAAGDVVNTAARLQAAAPVNGVLVGEQTQRATRQAIDYREAEAVAAKGKAEPVVAWEAVEARSRVGVERSHGPSLVGRQSEIALLAGALDRARRESSVQLVTLVGVPGIGKSRLVYELFEQVELDPELVRWRQGRCLPYGDGVTFWALGEIVKAEAGILESDAPAEVESKLAALGAERSVVSHLRPLVGLGTGSQPAGGDGLAEAFAAWRRFLEGLAEQGPLVLVLEDLHWSGDELLDFVDHLVEWASGIPILVVCTARPELLERRPSWSGGKPNALTISLSPLSDEETAQLVGELVPGPSLDAETRAELLVRAGGNPLYAEQYSRILAERGGIAELPETVQGIIAARLDLLEPEQKELLQDAAVLGRTFWSGWLASAMDLDRTAVEERLHELERGGFVRRERRSAVAEETQYAFPHVLVRDVAYAQLPRAERAELHRRAAAWVESIGRPEDLAEMLADHYLRALEWAAAAGVDAADLTGPARRALRDAGDRAAALYAAEAAERLYDAALELTPADDPDRVELLYRRAVPLGPHAAGGDPARLGAARDALLASGDTDRAAELELLLAEAARIQGDRELADRHRASAEALLGDGPPTRSRAWVLARLAFNAFLMGEDERTSALATRASAAAEEVGWDQALSESLNLIGSMRVGEGDDGGIADLERSVELAVASGALGVQARALNNLAAAHQSRGDLERGYRRRLEGARAAERLGSKFLQHWFEAILVDHLYRRGDWDEAQRAAELLLADPDATAHIASWQLLAVRALLRLAKGDDAGARADADDALASGRAVGEVQAVTFVLPATAHILTMTSEAMRATELVRELMALLRDRARMDFAVINLPLLASAALRLGLGDEVVDGLARHPESPWTEAARAYLDHDFTGAAEILGRAGAKPDEAEARLRAAEQLAAGGRRAEADEELARALDFYRSVGATRYLREAEALGAAPA